jgi:hypothetical protein
MSRERLDHRPNVLDEWVKESHLGNGCNDHRLGDIQPCAGRKPGDLDEAEHRHQPLRRQELQVERGERSLGDRGRDRRCVGHAQHYPTTC